MSEDTPVRDRGFNRPSLSPVFAQIRAARLFAGPESEEDKAGSLGSRSRSSSQERMAGAVNRRQQQWETQLEDSVFLKGAIKPIVDDMTALKPPVPYALRQALLKYMNKTIHFQDNDYGGGGAAGPVHADALYLSLIHI